jgi:hypothetical protein
MTSRYFLLPLLFFGIHTPLAAQKHDYNWTIGYDTGNPITSEYGGSVISFNESPTVAIKNNQKLNFEYYGTACSDSSGNLLFYTNGISIHNYLHQLIENGDTINPGDYWDATLHSGYASTIGPFALPYPGHPNQYVLFHTGLEYDVDSFYLRISPFYCTIVEMSANNGAGKVLIKNQVLAAGDLCWPAACKHGNGRDWWITVAKHRFPIQYTFLLSPDGISGPYEQVIGAPFSPEVNDGRSKSIFSPDGRIYVRHDGLNGPRIMDFDRCTGLFSNLRLLPYPPEVYSWSAAFSEDSRFLYLSRPSMVWSVDMQANNLSTSFDTLGRYNWTYSPAPPWGTGISELQEGADGKIYASTYSGSSRCMNRIERPLLAGLAADLNFGSFKLPRWYSLTMCHYPNYRLGENDGSPCDTLNAQAPGDGFIKTMYDAAGKPRVKAQNDYTILPMAPATPSEEARAEKLLWGDHVKVAWEDRLRRQASGGAAKPVQHNEKPDRQ